MGTDIDINRGFDRLKSRGFSQMGLLMLSFYGIIGEAAIDIVTVDSNTHSVTFAD